MSESCQIPAKSNTGANRRTYIVLGLIIFLVALTGLVVYKSAGSFSTIQGVQSSGKWTKPVTLNTLGALEASLSYFKIIWPALVFGILIGAAVRAFISPRWIMKLLGTGQVRQQVVAAVAGVPLMLCSCCVTPIFTSVYERGTRLGPALALMLASPGLNLAALILTFMLFSPEISIARLGLTLIAVFGLTALVGKLFEKSKTQETGSHIAACDASVDEFRGWGDWTLKFIKSVGYMTLVTVPLITAGVLLSSLLLPSLSAMNQTAAILTVACVALISVLIALPTFFEIPLAFLLLNLSAPTGAAAALLFAGPIINLPSLFVLARETNVKVSLALGAGLFLLAFLGGIII